MKLSRATCYLIDAASGVVVWMTCALRSSAALKVNVADNPHGDLDSPARFDDGGEPFTFVSVSGGNSTWRWARGA